MPDIENRQKLLEDISLGLYRMLVSFGGVELSRIIVIFSQGNDECARGDLPTALRWLVHNLEPDKGQTLAHADKALVRRI